MINIFALFAINIFYSEHVTILDTLDGAMGVNIHFASPKEEELASIRNAGLGWVRVDFKWASSEMAKGLYDFSAYDHLIDSLALYKIRPLLILSYGNPLYDSGGPPRTDIALAAFSNWAAAAAERFRGRGVIWEVWNEPNMPGFWPPEPKISEYMALLRRASKAIRKVDPNAVLVGPAHAGMAHNELEQCLKLGLLDLVDGVSFHPYRNLMPETILEGLQSYQRLINKWSKGAVVPLVISEWGYSSCASEDASCVPDSMQALWLVRLRLITWIARIPLTIWYDWQDDGNDISKREYRYGLVKANSRFSRGVPLAPKQSYEAQSIVADWLESMEGKEFSKAWSGAYMIRGSRKGRKAIIVWTENSPSVLYIPKIGKEISCVTFRGKDCGVLGNELGANKIDALPTPRLYEAIK